MSGGGEISNENIIFPEKQRCIRHNARPHHNLKNILNALIKYQGNKTKAAKELGISRIHLYRILNKFNE
jgi:transcriptional regulator of acetoin/glycerol metabolism